MVAARAAAAGAATVGGTSPPGTAAVGASKVGYDNGAFRMLIRTPKFRTVSDTQFEGRAVRSDLVALSDVAVEADAEKVSPTQLAYGLTCRRGANGEFYAGLLYSEGQATIEQIAAPGARGGGILGSAQLSTASTPGRKHLRLECSGAAGGAMTVKLFLNGTPVVAGADPEALAASPVGMFAFASDGVPAEVAFDNFEVKTLPAAPLR